LTSSQLNTDFNWQADYPYSTVTSNFIHSNSVSVRAIDSARAVLGTIFTYGGDQDADIYFELDRNQTPVLMRFTTGGGVYYNGADGTYGGPLNGLLIENTFKMQIKTDNHFSLPQMLSAPMNLIVNPFFI
jgi:hypothetical protein